MPMWTLGVDREIRCDNDNDIHSVTDIDIDNGIDGVINRDSVSWIGCEVATHI